MTSDGLRDWSSQEGLYKIGGANDPGQRLYEFQTADYERLELCFAVISRNSRALESKLHSNRTLPRARTRRVLADFGVGVWGVNQKPE